MSDGAEEGMASGVRRPGAWVRRAWTSRRARYATVAAVTVLVAVVTGTGVWRGRQTEVRVPSVPGHASSAEQAALGYLTALSKGRSADVLAYLSSPPGSTIFMTDAVLAESRKTDPITDIEVQRGAGARDVVAYYNFGDRRMKDRYTVEKCADGFWRIGSGSSNGYITVALAEGVAAKKLTVNGVLVPPDARSLDLLPGTYRLGGDSSTTVVSPESLVLPVLSDDALFNPGVSLDPFNPVQRW